jgi:hypothetical protein
VVRLGGKDFYVGPWGTQVARNEYDRLVAEWLASGRKAPAAAAAATTVSEIVAAFWSHAKNYYRYPDAASSKEISSYRDTPRPLHLHNHQPHGIIRQVAPVLIGYNLIAYDVGLSDLGFGAWDFPASAGLIPSRTSFPTAAQ